MESSVSVPVSQATRVAGQQSVRATVSAFWGFFVDMFDVYLPVVALGPAMGYFLPADLPETLAAILGSAIFAVTLIGRPLGSVIFGHLADKIGRRRMTILSIAGFGTVTLLIACLPGYNTMGIAAAYLLILLRLIDGIFLGGEYTAANVLAMEHAPKEKRSLFSSFIHSGFPLGYLAITVVTWLLLHLLPKSAYVAWGWRVPFVIGGLLAFAVIIPYRRTITESHLWEATTKSSSPIRQLFSRQYFGTLAQAFTLMSGCWLTLNMVTAVLPSVFRNTLQLPDVTATLLMMVSFFVSALCFPVVGMISQAIGRRAFYASAGAVITVISAYAYYLVVSGRYVQNVPFITILTIVAAVPIVVVWAIPTAYLNERFPTNVRSSGFGVAYSWSVIIPAFYSVMMVGLADIMPQRYTPIPLIVIGGLLMMVGALWGPETRDVDFVAMERPE